MPKTIITIIGARPQFIKAAVLSRTIRQEKWKNSFREIIIHTGQHYDANMSEIFFREMDIPDPDYNLNIGSGTHGKMTGEMLIHIEEVLLSEKPDIVLVYGDTNSTLAGALAASKLLIPLAHVEAGLRSFWKAMPEEQNRIITDHLSEFLFCPTVTACENLKNEGIVKGVKLSGDIMLDASTFYQKKVNENIKKYPDNLARKLNISVDFLHDGFSLLTVHRAENTDNPQNLKNIISAINKSKIPSIFPVHPRTRKLLDNLNIKFDSHVKLIDPIGYLDMLELEMRCKFIVTDSGGVQKEAFFTKKPCITLREQTEWIETVEHGWNTLVGTDPDKLLNTIKNISVPEKYPILYGDGNCSEKILTSLF